MTKLIANEQKIKDTAKVVKDGDSLSAWVYPEARKVDPGVLERRRRVAVCWNQLGMDVQSTADELGVSNATISKDRRWLLSMWTSLVEADVVELVSREVRKLDAQETELWAAWELSKQDEVEETQEIARRRGDDTGDGPGMVLVRRITTSRIPEVKFMDGILRCQERRAKLLGLDKAVTFEGATFSFATFVEGAFNTNKEYHQKQLVEPEPIDVTPIITIEGGGHDGEFSATNS